MRAAWRGAAREVVVDPDARTTVQNLANALNDVFRVDASEVVVVTSSWHARRATAAMRWFLRRRDVGVRAESPPGRSTRAALRELALWPLLPFQLWQAGGRAGLRAARYERSAWIRCFAWRNGPPPRPARAASASARIESAVSAWLSAPMSSPHGPLIRSSSASLAPASSSRSRRRSWFRREPSAPM